MPQGEQSIYGVYTASYPGGGKAVRLTLNDHLVQLAEIGDIDAQNQVCRHYKEASGHRNHVTWFTLRQHLARIADHHDPHDDVGEGGCGCECKGCEDLGRHCHHRNRGCKR